MARLTSLLLGAAFAVATVTGAMAADDSHLKRATTEAVKASGHASASAAHGIAASGKVTSAAAAIPLAIGGAVLSGAGALSTGAAQDLSKASATPIGAPLEVTDETITVVPPDQALKPKDGGTAR